LPACVRTPRPHRDAMHLAPGGRHLASRNAAPASARTASRTVSARPLREDRRREFVHATRHGTSARTPIGIQVTPAHRSTFTRHIHDVIFDIVSRRQRWPRSGCPQPRGFQRRPHGPLEGVDHIQRPADSYGSTTWDPKTEGMSLGKPGPPLADRDDGADRQRKHHDTAGAMASPHSPSHSCEHRRRLPNRQESRAMSALNASSCWRRVPRSHEGPGAEPSTVPATGARPVCERSYPRAAEAGRG
jgi:hypothetical protein